MIKELKKLHSECFSDSSSYIDLFFKTRYKKSNRVLIKYKNKIATALYLTSKLLRLNTKIIKTFFISGVATSPLFRYMGFAKKNIRKTIHKLNKRKIPFVFLHPFNVDFYKNLGFETASFSHTTTTKKILNKYSFKEIDYGDIPNLIELYKLNAQNSASFIRDKKDFEQILKEHFIDGDKGFLVYEDKQIRGYYFLFGDSIEEFVAKNTDILNDIPENKAVLIDKNDGDIFGLGRVCNIKKAIEFNLKPSVSTRINIKVIDTLYEKNNKIMSLLIENGKIISMKKSNTYSFELSIGELFLLTFGKKHLLKNKFSSELLDLFDQFPFINFDQY